MPTKQDILDNVEHYSTEEIVQYIKDGIVTLAELMGTGRFDRNKRLNVQNLIEASERIDWEDAKNSESIEKLQKYLDCYPEGAHREEARTLKENLQATEAEREPSDWTNAENSQSLELLQHYLDNYPTGAHRDEARALMKEIREADETWSKIDKNSTKALQSFCESYPKSIYKEKARELIIQIRTVGVGMEALYIQINEISTAQNLSESKNVKIYNLISGAINNNQISKDDLIKAFNRDCNFLNASVICRLSNDGYIDVHALNGIGIHWDFIHHMLADLEPAGFAAPEQLDRISKSSTEIYFWGIPSSGKSCALGAILSVANNGSVARYMMKDNDCQGYGYMNRLSALFNANGSVGILPEGTSIYSTYEMGFELGDYDCKKHTITCIDLAGELVRCMYKSDAGLSLFEDQENALKTLTNILIDNRTKSRKMHFFVIEYGAEDRLYEGFSQSTYLDAAVAYLGRTGIFKRDTDSIYILISKVDKAKTDGKDLKETLKAYINEYYKGFYNGLTAICETYEINGGVVEIVPFSLGKVCFQNYCQFDSRYANSIVEIILKSSKGIRTGWLGKIFKSLTK